MNMSITYSSPQTAKSGIIEAIGNGKKNISDLAKLEQSGSKYNQTSDMTQAQSAKLNELLSAEIRVTTLNDAAQSFMDDARLAMDSVKRMQDKVSNVTSALSSVQNLTDASKATITTSINEALQTIQNELSISNQKGNYLWASGANSSNIPVGDIVHGVSYNPDGTSNTSYVTSLAAGNKVAIQDGVDIKLAFNPGDKSIADTIAALQMMRDSLAGGKMPSIEARNLLQQSVGELASFLGSDIRVRHQNAEYAIESNNNLLDEISENLENFKADPMAIASKLADIEISIGSMSEVLASFFRGPQIWDRIRG